MMVSLSKYWDLKLDWVYRRSCICSKMSKQVFPCIGLEIGLGHILFVISFLDIDMMTKVKYWDLELDWVHRRSCICSTMSKPGFPCIGLEIGSGHILCVISFLGIDMMANLSFEFGIGLGYI